MTDNVVYPSFITKLDIPVDRVINAALEAGLTGVVVLGWDENEYFASSIADGADVLWLMERLKKQLLE